VNCELATEVGVSGQGQCGAPSLGLGGPPDLSKGCHFSRPQLASNAPYGQDTIILAVAQSHTFDWAAKTDTFAPSVARIIARDRHRTPTPSPRPSTTRLRVYSITSRRSRHSGLDITIQTNHIYVLRDVTTHNDALQYRHDARTRLHENTAETAIVRATDAVDPSLHLPCDTGVSRLQAGGCRLLRHGGARPAHGSNRKRTRHGGH
jgi:hypothetical protein